MADNAPPPAADWANLGDDLLRLVAGKVNNGLDYTAFRSVCTTFRAAAPRRKLPPLLMFPYDNNYNSIAFYDPSSRDIRTVLAPECEGTVFCGASHGWMVRMDASARVFLYNPITRVRFNLPRATRELAEASGFPVVMTEDEVLMRNQAGLLVPLGLAFMRFVFIHEALLSAPLGAEGADCVVMAILSASQKVAYCRPGDAYWTIVDTGLHSHVWSAAYCHQRFYLADNQDVAVLDVAGRSRVVRYHSLPFPQRSDNFRLLEWEGELLMLSPVLMLIQDEDWHDHVNGAAWPQDLPVAEGDGQDEGAEEDEGEEEEGEGEQGGGEDDEGEEEEGEGEQGGGEDDEGEEEEGEGEGEQGGGEEDEGEEEEGEGGEEEEEEEEESDEDQVPSEDEFEVFGLVERFDIVKLDALASTWTLLHNLGEDSTVFWSQHHCWTMIKRNLQGCNVGCVYGSTMNPGIPEVWNDERHCIRVVNLEDGRAERICCNWIPRDTYNIAWFMPRFQ